MSELKLTDNEAIVLGMLVSIGAAAFDVPGGPAYLIRDRLQKKFGVIVTTDDINNMIRKVQGVMAQGETKR